MLICDQNYIFVAYLTAHTNDFYIPGERIRKKLYSRLLELTNSQFDQWATDIHFNYRTKEAIFKNKDNLVGNFLTLSKITMKIWLTIFILFKKKQISHQIFAENSLKLALLVTLDFTGYLEFSWIRSHLDFAELNELTHTGSPSDTLTLKQVMEVVDFFYTVGAPDGITEFGGQRQLDSILPDWLLQVLFLLLDAQNQRGIDVLEPKFIDKIRRILTPRSEDDPSEITLRKRRILSVLFLSTKLIISSCKNIPSVLGSPFFSFFFLSFSSCKKTPPQTGGRDPGIE